MKKLSNNHKKEIYNSYVVEKLSIKATSEMLNISRSVIEKVLRENGWTRSCGGSNIKDLVGKKFGMLKVVRQVNNPLNSSAKWLCECECGSVIEVVSNSLIKGLTRSCGCYRRNINWKGYEQISGQYWNRAIKGAEERNLEFSITMKYVWDLYLAQDRKCKLSGIDITISPKYSKGRNRKNKIEQTASLDRIDSSKGYIEGNVQWVHKDVNKMKWKFNQEYFIDLCSKIHKTSMEREIPQRIV